MEGGGGGGGCDAGPSVAVVVFAVLLSKNLVLGVPDFLPPYKTSHLALDQNLLLWY